MAELDTGMGDAVGESLLRWIDHETWPKGPECRTLADGPE